MSWFTASAGVMFIAPDIHAQGGISAVIRNYQRSGFWSKCRCIHFSTYRDWDSKFVRIIYAVWRCCVFLPSVLIKRPAAISIHTSTHGSFYRKLFYILISRLLAIPVVIHIHPGSFFEFFAKGNTLTRFAVSTSAQLSEGLIFLSESALKQFHAVFPKVRMAVVPNPVDVELYESRNRAPMKGNYRILFMGWIIKEKGVYDIVDVIPDVITHFPQAKFIFAGNKEVEQLKEMIKDRHLSQYAEVLGWIEGKQKLDLLLTSRLLLLPSYSEGIPNVILEAMASGLPTITTPVGGIPSVFIEDENGYFVPPGNTRELASRIIQMLGDDNACERISNLTSRRAKEFYALEIIGRQLENIYKNLVNQGI
ncbi:MAG: glycosyltransferase family 4 protein [Nitrospira sp.]|nr:glycosyltransferase family 4 protein [Nitrospira sp.]